MHVMELTDDEQNLIYEHRAAEEKRQALVARQLDSMHDFLTDRGDTVAHVAAQRVYLYLHEMYAHDGSVTSVADELTRDLPEIHNIINGYFEELLREFKGLQP